ncbi:MAG: hypothetical protein OXC61_11575 [Flavobacteriaceae bacterium]|nr:hypothetical protein [Flavobacteriaceae bacterium]
MGKFCFISEDSGSFEQLKGNIALINDHSSGILVHGVYSRHNLKKIQDAASIFLAPPRLFLIH